MKKTVEAWAILTRRGSIARVSDDGWSFYDAVFRTKTDARDHDGEGTVVPCTITYNLPTP